MIAQRELYPKSWRGKIKYLPFLMATGIGLSLKNSKVVIEALLGKQSEFVRTPKFHVEARTDSWEQKNYLGKAGWIPVIELCLAGYFLFTIVYSLGMENYLTCPFLMLFFLGYSYMGLMSLFQTPVRRLRKILPAALRARVGAISAET